MKNNLKILFLAKYAPSYIGEFTSQKLEDLVYANYHEDIYKILKKSFPNVISSNNPKILLQKKLKFDFVFSLLNQMTFKNSEIFISSMCEYLNLPYLGATPNLRAVAEDKHLAKLNSEYLNINTPNWNIINYNETSYSIPLNFPVFIKPRFGATSNDIDNDSKCLNDEEAYRLINRLQKKKIDLIIEEFIEGTVYTVGVLNNFNEPKVLIPIKETSDKGVITYKQKRYIISGLQRTPINNKGLLRLLQSLSLKYFNSLKPMDYARFDFIVDRNGIPFFIEFNLCCNLGKKSAISLSAENIGISYEMLINNILFSSLHRNQLSDLVQPYKF